MRTFIPEKYLIQYENFLRDKGVQEDPCESPILKRSASIYVETDPEGYPTWIPKPASSDIPSDENLSQQASSNASRPRAESKVTPANLASDTMTSTLSAHTNFSATTGDDLNRPLIQGSPQYSAANLAQVRPAFQIGEQNELGPNDRGVFAEYKGLHDLDRIVNEIAYDMDHGHLNRNEVRSLGQILESSTA